MRRRELIKLLGGAAIAWPGIAAAQQAGRVYRVGLVMGTSSPVFAVARPVFLDEMQKGGFVEGKNLVLDARSNQVDNQRLLALMADLVASKTEVIIAGGTEQTLRAAVAAAPSTPIVMWANNFDPIAGGYVQSLAKPGGNVTGVFTRQPELAEKQVELLKETFPQRNRLALVWDAQTLDQYEAAERRARALKIEVTSHRFEKMPYDVPAMFHAIAASGAQLLQVASGPNMGNYQQIIAEQALQHRLPAIFIFKSYVDRGGLMSYGVNIEANFRRIAVGRENLNASPPTFPSSSPAFELRSI